MHEQAADDGEHELVLDRTAMAPSRPPSASDPVSPMKIWAGGALNHRKPRPAPINAPQITMSSPASGTWLMSR